MTRTAETHALARLFKALSDPNRLAILLLLRETCGDSCRFEADEAGATVSRIAERFDIGLSTVSHHLKELKHAGLIDCVKRGQWVHCSPNPTALKRLREFLAASAEQPEETRGDRT